MKVKALTYNLLFNKALPMIENEIRREKPDIIFFQEIALDTAHFEKIESLGYNLADFSISFRRGKNVFGVATFYRPNRLELTKTQSFSLPSSLYQQLIYVLQQKKSPRTVLKTVFKTRSEDLLIAYNIHLTPVALNGLRMKQMYNTFEDLHLHTKHAIIIAGDFNYPYGRKKLESVLEEYKLKEATHNISHTHEHNILYIAKIKLKLDYILYKNLKLTETRRLEIKHSDHYPILSTFDM